MSALTGTILQADAQGGESPRPSEEVESQREGCCAVERTLRGCVGQAERRVF